MNQLTYLFDASTKAYAVADTEKKTLIYINNVAKTRFHITEDTYSLEDLFQHCPHSLKEMISELEDLCASEEQSLTFHDLYTVNEVGEKDFVDLSLGFLNQEKTEIFFELTLKVDERERSLRDIIDHSSKPMFLAPPDAEFTVYYANQSFYQLLASDKSTFSSAYKNAFLSSLLEVNNEVFASEVHTHLQSSPDFRKEIEVTTVQDVKKQVCLDLQYVDVGKDGKMLLGLLLPTSEVAQTQQTVGTIDSYFDAVQELTKGALFYVDVTTKKARHHSKLLKDAGFPEQVENFPHCVLHMFHPEDSEGFVEQGNRLLEGHKESYELRYRTGTDTYSWARINATPIADVDGKILEIVGRIQNIDAEKALLNRDIIDPLTNAYKKEYAIEVIESTLAQAQEDMTHAFFFMDLDDFKDVNDTLGHTFGDYLLQELGSRLGQQLRSDDVIGRVGGDEFVFLLKNVKKMEILLTKANNILETIGTNFDDGTTQHTIHGSIGISIFPAHGKTYEELFQNADYALNRSKQRGKNMATIYNPPLPKRNEEASETVSDDSSVPEANEGVQGE